MKAKTLAAALTLIFCLSASARATDYYCTTLSQLTTALANAVGGDTITLQAGNTGYTYSNNVLYRAPSTSPSGYPTTPDTTYWNSWNSAIKTGVSLSAGQHVLRFAVDGDFLGFQSLRIVNTAATQSPYGGSAFSMPGTISAMDFDTGGEQVAYHDNTAGCDGDCSHRSSDVDLYSSVGTVYKVSSGEWMEYTMNIGSSGTYSLTVQAASDSGGGTFHVELDGVDVTGTMTFPDTGSWSTFQAVTKTGISLSSGQKVMRVVIDSSNSPAGTNLGSIKSIQIAP